MSVVLLPNRFVGPDKNSLDHVSDENLPVLLLVQSFGRFLMYHVATVLLS